LRAREMQWCECGQRKECDRNGSRRRVVIEQLVRQVMKRYKLNTMMDREVGRDKRKEKWYNTGRHRKVRDGSREECREKKKKSNVCGTCTIHTISDIGS